MKRGKPVKPAKKMAMGMKKEPTLFDKWADWFNWPKGITFEQKKLLRKLWRVSPTMRKQVYKKFREMEQADARRMLSFIFSHDKLQKGKWRSDLHEKTMTGATLALWEKAGREFTEKTVIKYLDEHGDNWKDNMPFYRFLSEIGGRDSGKAIVRSMLYSKREAENVSEWLERNKIGGYLEGLAFRLLPKGNKGRLQLLKRFCQSLGTFAGIKINLLQFAAAADKKILANLPSNLKDRRQRKRIEYLYSLRESLRTHSMREVAEALKLIEPLKKK